MSRASRCGLRDQCFARVGRRPPGRQKPRFAARIDTSLIPRASGKSFKTLETQGIMQSGIRESNPLPTAPSMAGNWLAQTLRACKAPMALGDRGATVASVLLYQ